MTPFKAVFGEDGVTLAERVLEIEPASFEGLLYGELTVVERLKKLKGLQEQLIQELNEAQEREPSVEDQTQEAMDPFEVGDKVWVCHYTEPTRKFEAIWHGPCIIKKILEVSMVVEEETRGRVTLHTVHASRVKRYIERAARPTGFPEIILWTPPLESEDELESEGTTTPTEPAPKVQSSEMEVSEDVPIASEHVSEPEESPVESEGENEEEESTEEVTRPTKKRKRRAILGMKRRKRSQPDAVELASEELGGTPMFEVEDIIGHKYGICDTAYDTRAGRPPTYRYWYHLKFKGYPVNKNDWYDSKGLKNMRQIFDEYRNRWTGEGFPKQAGNQDGAPLGKGEMSPARSKK